MLVKFEFFYSTLSGPSFAWCVKSGRIVTVIYYNNFEYHIEVRDKLTKRLSVIKCFCDRLVIWMQHNACFKYLYSIKYGFQIIYIETL